MKSGEKVFTLNKNDCVSMVWYNWNVSFEILCICYLKYYLLNKFYFIHGDYLDKFFVAKSGWIKLSGSMWPTLSVQNDSKIHTSSNFFSTFSNYPLLAFNILIQNLQISLKKNQTCNKENEFSKVTKQVKLSKCKDQ